MGARRVLLPQNKGKLPDRHLAFAFLFGVASAGGGGEKCWWVDWGEYSSGASVSILDKVKTFENH